MIISVHQPAYLPWLGYFERISRSDIFVFLDTVQFEKNSFINRNKIKTSQGWQWLTIPVKIKGHTNSTLEDTEVDDIQPWRSKHLKSIQLNYLKADFFTECFPEIERLLYLPTDNLSELCWQHLNFWIGEFGIKTTMIRSSQLNISSCNSDLVLDICKYFSADHYLSGPMGRDYLDEDDFSSAGIAVEYQNFKHPTYPQRWGDFEPYMAVIDFWMNCGSVKLPFV